MVELTYDQILNMAQRLDPSEQLQLLEKLAAALRQQYGLKSKRSLLELDGLGKDNWKGIDTQQYIQEERESWNG